MADAGKGGITETQGREKWREEGSRGLNNRGMKGRREVWKEENIGITSQPETCTSLRLFILPLSHFSHK